MENKMEIRIRFVTAISNSILRKQKCKPDKVTDSNFKSITLVMFEAKNVT